MFLETLLSGSPCHLADRTLTGSLLIASQNTPNTPQPAPHEVLGVQGLAEQPKPRLGHENDMHTCWQGQQYWWPCLWTPCRKHPTAHSRGARSPGVRDSKEGEKWVAVTSLT